MSAGAPTPLAKLVRRIEALEAQVRSAQPDSERALREGRSVLKRDVRIAKTFESSPGTYPAEPANTFDIRFVDTALDVWSPGDRTLTATPRSAGQQTVATTVDGHYVPVDTLVRVVFLHRKWWIIDPQVPTFPTAIVTGGTTFSEVSPDFDNSMPLFISADPTGLLEPVVVGDVDLVRFTRPCSGLIVFYVEVGPIEWDDAIPLGELRWGWFQARMNSISGAALLGIEGADGKLPVSQHKAAHTTAWISSFAGRFDCAAANGTFSIHLRRGVITASPLVTVRIHLSVLG